MADAKATTLTILYFAWLRERTGTSQENVTPPAGVGTVDDLVNWLAGRSPGHASAFANRRTVRCAVNQDFADPATRVQPGDEVAFFPPVTGG
jgi:molybdopterin synthase sulfur carrier subunit